MSGLKQHGIQLIVMYVSKAGPPLAQNDNLLHVSLILVEDQTYKVMMVTVMVMVVVI